MNRRRFLSAATGAVAASALPIASTLAPSAVSVVARQTFAAPLIPFVGASAPTATAVSNTLLTPAQMSEYLLEGLTKVFAEAYSTWPEQWSRWPEQWSGFDQASDEMATRSAPRLSNE